MQGRVPPEPEPTSVRRTQTVCSIFQDANILETKLCRQCLPFVCMQVRKRGETARRNYSAKHQKGHVRGAGKT